MEYIRDSKNCRQIEIEKNEEYMRECFFLYKWVAYKHTAADVMSVLLQQIYARNLIAVYHYI